MKKLNFFLASFCLMSLFACSGGGDTASTENTTTDQPDPEAVATSEEMSQKMEAGQTVYNSYCIACHQKDGSGVPGAFPPLKETDWVQGDKEKLISIVLNGLQGPITVNGEQYNNVMTPHNFLSDDEVAAVLTFVRNSFGNNASEVMAEEVAALRDQVEK
ncbi:MAG: c-type cytochrome [Cyclobacteriaceae bacterium]